MNTKEKEFLTGFAGYLGTRKVEYNMHQGFSVHFRNKEIGFNCIWVQQSFEGRPYIHSYIGYCFTGFDDAEEFEEELEKKYPDFKFYADRYKYKYEIGLSQTFQFVSYDDVYRRVLKMEDVILAGYALGQERFKGNFER